MIIVTPLQGIFEKIPAGRVLSTQVKYTVLCISICCINFGLSLRNLMFVTGSTVITRPIQVGFDKDPQGVICAHTCASSIILPGSTFSDTEESLRHL